MVIFHSYVGLPEGIWCDVGRNLEWFYDVLCHQGWFSVEMSIQWFVNVDMIWCDMILIWSSIIRSYNDETLVYGIYANILEYIYICMYRSIHWMAIPGQLYYSIQEINLDALGNVACLSIQNCRSPFSSCFRLGK